MLLLFLGFVVSIFVGVAMCSTTTDRAEPDAFSVLVGDVVDVVLFLVLVPTVQA